MAIEEISNSVYYTYIIILVGHPLKSYYPHFTDEKSSKLPTVTELEVGKSCILYYHIGNSEILEYVRNIRRTSFFFFFLTISVNLNSSGLQTALHEIV